MPSIDLNTIDEKLAKAKEEVAFWERAKAVFLDPRISQIAAPPTTGNFSIRPRPRPYGELKRRVWETLPPAGHPGITTQEIADAMQRSGFVFVSQTPMIAVNEALVSLEDQVQNVGKRGLAKLWTKGEGKTEAPA